MIDLIVTDKLSVSIGYNGRLHSVGVYLYGAATPARDHRPGDLSRNECELSFPLRPVRGTLRAGIAWWRPQCIVWFKDRKRVAWPAYARWPSERRRA